jgi:hypothetical protein
LELTIGRENPAAAKAHIRPSGRLAVAAMRERLADLEGQLATGHAMKGPGGLLPDDAMLGERRSELAAENRQVRLAVILRARWVVVRARWVVVRARWVTLRARWVTLRARWETLRARWVTLRARWVTLRARWVTLRARWVTLRARWVTLRAR